MEKEHKAVIQRFDKLKLAIGLIFMIFGTLLSIAFVSYAFNWRADQSQLGNLFNKEIPVENALGKLGNTLAHFFIGKGIGIIALLFPLFLIIVGLRIIFNFRYISLKNYIIHASFWSFFTPLLFAAFSIFSLPYYGIMGFEIIDFLKSFINLIGVIALLILIFSIYVIANVKNPHHLFNKNWKQLLNQKVKRDSLKKETQSHTTTVTNEETINMVTETKKTDTFTPIISPEIELQNTIKEPEYLDNYLQTVDLEEDEEDRYELINEEEVQLKNQSSDFEIITTNSINNTEEELKIEIATPPQTSFVYEDTDALAENLVQKHGEYDQRLDLPKYQFPIIDFLKQFDNENIQINTAELEANKNKIVETLSHYKIGIAKIKATIGPSVTLYEIIPEAGIRISKIKNLEDDIALSLAALGIRIIAPIPGKGTIGIEVPNKKPQIVSMRSVISSEKFQKSGDMALPIVFGKTISNEPYVVDLAKMPHLLMAGATGQGKSVGLNAVINSLLYKKHPAELKFVLVDPKKVELTLYNKIERHYLAKLPDIEEAIITDNTKVINTLNSLCIEMDNRYELLKDAMVRNIIEYNTKFKQRKLNPNEGHRYLPYIVLIIDEFADLIMTAGKEVETPVARLAQLARAIGIHLIVATQRPSVNVITGIIKANFPARVAFRVTSKIDSRTILDAGGAEQLIGRGDMLYSTGNEVIRLQCAFIDTPEVEQICDFIGNQQAYPNALLLPEYVGEQGEVPDVDLSERDKMFDDAARLIVIAQQGSASLLQRKLKLGYNRAGRIIDQLEVAGIVGPFEGSKARQVLIQDENSLEQILSKLKNE